MKKFLYILSAFILLCVIIVFVVILSLASDIPRLPDDLRMLAYSPVTEIYGRNGELISTTGGREYVAINRISPNFLNAVIAVEDRRFYKHHGIDHIATVRALLQNIIRLGGAPGGSTITQQLAKNFFFTFERSWARKILEAMAAMAIEDRFSKDEILETYCNLVPFGQYSYGIEQASLTYFGKHASDLSIHEAALLAGLPNAPSRLNPFHHMDRAKARQKTILRRMAEQGVIAENAVDSLAALPIKLADIETGKSGGSFVIDYALELSKQAIGSELVDYGGVRINISIDSHLQEIAEQTLSAGLDELEDRLLEKKDNQSRLEGALVAIDVGTGRVVALVGGRNYNESPYNRAVKALRPPGSSFKPATYLTALEEPDINPATIVVDMLVELKVDSKRTWKPENFDKGYFGQLTLKLALMKSINSVAAQLIDRVRPEKVVKTAKALGITTHLEPHLTLCLGAQGVTPLELANMYSTLAREGDALEPHFVKRIESRDGQILYQHLAVEESRFAPETVYQLLNMMTGVIEGGTGVIVKYRGFKGIAACKTGTSSDFRDSWFCGATPYLVVVVWVGYDDFTTMRLKNRAGVTGASGAAPIWADFMIQATAHEPVRDFPRPPGIVTYFMDPIKGTVSAEQLEGYISVALLEKDAERLLAEAVQDTVGKAIE
jgi:penicillin-binding protein 1A